MSIIFLLALAGAFIWLDYLRRQGKVSMPTWSRSEPIEATPVPGSLRAGSDAAKLQLEPQVERRAGIDRRRHTVRLASDRRHAA